MVSRRRRFSEETFAPSQIVPTNDSWFYYFPKIVGTSKESNFFPLRRDKIIEEFFNFFGNMYSIAEENMPLVKQKIVDSITAFNSVDDLTFNTYDSVYLIPEPNNPYDSNAISVRILNPWDGPSRTVDVGYLPASHAREITEHFPQRYVIGAVRDGRGMRLHIVLSTIFKEVHGSNCVVSINKEVIKPELPKFLSLKKMRKYLEA